MKLFLVCLLLFSCGKKKPIEPNERSVTIAEKAQLYKRLSPSWAHSKCDSLGFTALCKLAGGCADANIFEAEAEAGRWYRSPEKDCYDKGESESDISKDMFVMLAPYLYMKNDKDALKRVVKYALEHNLVMGRGDLSRTVMSPSLLILYARMAGLPVPFGRKDQDNSVEDDPDIGRKVDFRDHLNVVFAIAESMVNKSITTEQLKYFKALAFEEPNNALFQAIYHRYEDGDQREAIRILSNEKLFPSNRLPTSEDRCEEYLWQRAETPKDWQPCEGDYVHDGVDFIFAAWIAGQI